MSDNADRISDFLKVLHELSTGGQLEAGLEIHTDAGVRPEVYVQIPSGFARSVTYGRSGLRSDPDSGDVYVRGKKFFTRCSGTFGIVSSVTVAPVTKNQLILFIRANFNATGVDHVTYTSNEWRARAIGLRFYGTVWGLITTVHNNEYVVVLDDVLTTPVEGEEDIAEKICSDKMRRDALILFNARFLNWRKTNHATGQGKLANLIRRSVKIIEWANDEVARTNNFISFLYNNIHQICNHAVSAMWYGNHAEHWAKINPKYGLMAPSNVADSFRMRSENSGGVAGTAVVMDCCQVLKQLYYDRTEVALDGRTQVDSLIGAANQVKEYGLLTGRASEFWASHAPKEWKAEYSIKIGSVVHKWFDLTPRPIDQKSSSHAALTADLATAAILYLDTPTLSKAPALVAHAKNTALDARRKMWAALKTKVSGVSADDSLLALEVVRATGGVHIAGTYDFSGLEKAQASIREYNGNSRKIATLLGISVPFELQEIDQASLDRAAARAKEIAESMKSVNAEIRMDVE